MNRLTLAISLLLWACGCKATGERAPSAVHRNAVEGAVRAPEPSKVTLDVKDEDLAVVLQSILRQAGVTILLDPQVKEKVTIHLEGVPWREALRAIAWQTPCKVLEVTDAAFRLTQPRTVSAELRDVEAKVAIETLARLGRANVVMPSDIQGKVTVLVHEVPWRDALEAVVKTVGYTIVEEDPASPRGFVRVVGSESLRTEAETRCFQLRHLTPEEPYRAILSDIEKWAIATR